MIETDKDIVSCSGDDTHPKVYIKVPGKCGYCDIEFVSVRSSVGIEQRPSKPWVAGSSPAGQANSKKSEKK